MEKSPSTMTSPPLGDWLESVFEHPVTKPSWWWNENAKLPLSPDKASREALDLLTTLCESPAVLAAYTDEQVAQGLWFLFDTSCSEYTTLLRNQDLPWAARQRCLNAILTLYGDLFAVRCAPVMGHPFSKPLNGMCYMLWDLSEALEPHPEGPEPEVDEACLAILSQTLLISHIACQDSALHGLGHWASAYPERVASTIDEFLRDNPAAPSELREFALRAREAKVP